VDEAQKRKIREQASAWLDERRKGEPLFCPVCNESNWQVGDMVEVREFDPAGPVVAGPVYPSFPIICRTCGHTMLFNAIVAGLDFTPEQPPIEGEEPEQPQPEEQPAGDEATAGSAEGK
jgi:hypothetical protein